MRHTLLGLLVLLLGALPAPSRAATLPSGFTETLVARLDAPTAMAFAPDGRLFVTQQGGRLRVIKNGTLLTAPFLTVTVDSRGERGLLGVAVDPNFASNQFIYVYYTVPGSPAHNRVSRFTANGDVMLAGSERVLLDLDALSAATNHNGGALHFGVDGKLYVAVGDNANSARAQSLTSRLGKILRINSDGTIPADNPFANQATGVNRAIYALGLRNPFTFAIQPETGRLLINDVGEAAIEEINDGAPGANYGWPNCEGPCQPPSASLRNPLHHYSRDGGRCAVTGGTFYNPVTAPFPNTYVGKYFFGDLCSGEIFFIDPDHPPAPGAAATFATNVEGSLVGLIVGPDGNLYRLVYSGELWRVQFTSSQAPAITQQPASRTATLGQSTTFSVAASGATPLTYRWQRNGVNIGGAIGPSYTLSAAALSDSGAKFRCVVSNAFGTVTSNEAVLTVSSNQTPTGTITAPTAGALYSAGQTINYAATGSDPEDGTLPAANFTWEVRFHHDKHWHPFVAPTSGARSGSFTIPITGETAANVWYRIILTVRDSAGLTATSFVDVNPRTTLLTLATVPSGLQVTLDGQPVVAPFSVLSVVGMTRTLGPVSPQTLNGSTYSFAAWSDGGPSTRSITTPAAKTTYTGSYQAGADGPVTAFPASTVILVGSPRSGSATHLSADDNVYYQVNSDTGGTRAANWYAVFNSVPKTLRNLRITYKGKQSQSCAQSVAIFRWPTNTWVHLNGRTVGTTEVLIADLAPGGALADYVSGSADNGSLRVRIRCTHSGNFFTSGDLLKIVYTP